MNTDTTRNNHQTQNIAKYQIGTKQNQAFLRQLREELLAFGKSFSSPGGSAYYLGADGRPLTDRPRETWITCRMMHVYCLGMLLQYPDSRQPAANALRGLLGELHDSVHGGWYAGRTSDGAILPDKQCYAHAFVLLAASSGILADLPGADTLLQDARAIYDRYFWQETAGLSCDQWNTAFTVPDDYRGLNANMHTVEAFLAVADAAGLEEYRQRAGRIITRVISWAEEHHWRLPEHFSKDWIADCAYNRSHPDDPFKPYGATPGHGMEWARLIVQWSLSSAAHTHNARQNAAHFSPLSPDSQSALPYLDAAQNLYRQARQDAWNRDGAPGFVYTTDWDGTPVIHDRMHWVLAEAINTAAVLWQVTGHDCYAQDYAQYMQYLDESVLDHVHGSWFHQLDRRNRPADSVWPGKPDLYHAVQSTLIPYAAPGLSIAAALATSHPHTTAHTEN